MNGQHVWQTKDLSGQPIPNSDRTLSVDWPLLRALDGYFVSVIVEWHLKVTVFGC